MRVLVAPNALKGSLTAMEAATAMAEGARAAGADPILTPVADGGDGLCDVLAAALPGAQRWLARVSGPDGEPRDANFLLTADGLAVLETAAANGLALLPLERRDPARAWGTGVGELIGAALDQGATRLLIGLGGSATNDLGVGAAAALGARFLDGGGDAVEPIGASLGRIEGIETVGLDPRPRGVEITALYDVDAPLFGPVGAAHRFGAQKGASPDGIERLETEGRRFVAVLERHRSDVIGLADLSGAGAAGGLGFGLAAFLGARLRRGADEVLDILGFDDLLDGVDLVLTAEGALDASSAQGKAPVAVARRAAARGVACVALAGTVALTATEARSLGFATCLPLCDRPMTLAEALARAPDLLREAAGRAVELMLAGRALSQKAMPQRRAPP